MLAAMAPGGNNDDSIGLTKKTSVTRRLRGRRSNSAPGRQTNLERAILQNFDVLAIFQRSQLQPKEDREFPTIWQCFTCSCNEADDYERYVSLKDEKKTVIGHGKFALVSYGTVSLLQRTLHFDAKEKNALLEFSVAVKRLRVITENHLFRQCFTSITDKCGSGAYSPRLLYLDCRLLCCGRVHRTDLDFLDEIEGAFLQQFGFTEAMNLNNYVPNGSSVEEVLREEMILEKAQKSPFVVKYLFSENHILQNEYWIITELCLGNLRQFFSNLDAESAEERSQMIYHLLIPIADALRYLHSVNIIHRDVKEDNILVSTYGVPKLCDFNLSYLFDDNGIHKFSMFHSVGAHFYKAPELVLHQDFTCKIDSWSLGITAWKLMKKDESYYSIFKVTTWEIMSDVYNAYLHKGHDDAQKQLERRLGLKSGGDFKPDDKSFECWFSKNFIQNFLAFDPLDRLSPEELLKGMEYHKKYCSLWESFARDPHDFNHISSASLRVDSGEIEAEFRKRMSTFQKKLNAALAEPGVNEDLRKERANSTIRAPSHRDQNLKDFSWTAVLGPNTDIPSMSGDEKRSPTPNPLFQDSRISNI